MIYEYLNVHDETIAVIRCAQLLIDRLLIFYDPVRPLELTIIYE